MKKIIETRKITQKIDIGVDCCDRCGKVMHYAVDTECSLEVEFHYGWHSNDSRDGDSSHLMYCEDCAPEVEKFLLEFNKNFKKPKEKSLSKKALTAIFMDNFHKFS